MQIKVRKIKDSITIRFPAKLNKAAKLKSGGGIRFSLENDILILEYLGKGVIKGKDIAILSYAVPPTICVNTKKVPEMAIYNFHNLTTSLDFEIVDDKMLVDLSAYKGAKKEKVETKKVGFGLLAAIKEKTGFGKLKK